VKKPELVVVSKEQGAFRLPKAPIDDFQKYLKVHGINCVRSSMKKGGGWDTTWGTQQRDEVLELTQPQQLDQAIQLFNTWINTWAGGSDAGAHATVQPT
jgi:hypothetical protein